MPIGLALHDGYTCVQVGSCFTTLPKRSLSKTLPYFCSSRRGYRRYRVRESIPGSLNQIMGPNNTLNNINLSARLFYRCVSPCLCRLEITNVPSLSYCRGHAEVAGIPWQALRTPSAGGSVDRRTEVGVDQRRRKLLLPCHVCLHVWSPARSQRVEGHSRPGDEAPPWAVRRIPPRRRGRECRGLLRLDEPQWGVGGPSCHAGSVPTVAVLPPTCRAGWCCDSVQTRRYPNQQGHHAWILRG